MPSQKPGQVNNGISGFVSGQALARTSFNGSSSVDFPDQVRWQATISDDHLRLIIVQLKRHYFFAELSPIQSTLRIRTNKAVEVSISRFGGDVKRVRKLDHQVASATLHFQPHTEPLINPSEQPHGFEVVGIIALTSQPGATEDVSKAVGKRFQPIEGRGAIEPCCLIWQNAHHQ